MKHSVIPYQLTVLEERSTTQGQYRLLRIEGDALLKYAVSVEDRAGSDLVVLNSNGEACRVFFEKLVQGELSSLQLGEVAEDFCHEHLLEIF